jgi:hypothetical protein
MSESLAHNPGEHDHGIVPLPHKMMQAKNFAGIIGVVGLLITLFGWFFQPEHFFRSMLFAWHFWLSISLGCLGFVMISHLTGGAWGAVIRRIGEAGFMNLWLLLLFFFILIPGYKYLFPWGHMEAFNPQVYADQATSLDRTENPTAATIAESKADWARVDELRASYRTLVHRAPLYNPLVFTLRTLLYFLVWLFLAFYLRLGSIKLDHGPDLVLRRSMRKVSAFGMVMFFVTTTGYCLDYVSGRETTWYSSILGFITAITIGLAGVSFMSLMVCYFADKKPMKDVLIPQHTNDLGNILLALVILWMYTCFAQFLIQWNGAMPEDVEYYTNRGIGVVRNGWQWIALLLLLGQFFGPFFLLLMKGLKRNPITFARICGLLLFMRVVDNLWTLAPNGPHRSNSGHIYFYDLTAWAGVGGIWVFLFVRNLGAHRLLAHNIADEPQVLTHEGLAHGTPAHF